MTHFLFIDGASLREFAKNVTERYFGFREPTFDLAPLVQDYERAFYYDGFPNPEPGETTEAYDARTATQRKILSAAGRVDRLHVYEGDVRRRNRRRGREQKMVDVMLAVDMMTHAFRGKMTNATLLSGDQDFTPVMRAMVDHGILTTILYPVDEAHEELLGAADLRREITLPMLWRWFSEETLRYCPPPTLINRDPAIPRTGEKIREWMEGRNQCELWRHEAGWTFTALSDKLNRYHATHSELQFLADYVPGTSIWFIPQDLIDSALHGGAE